MNKMKKIEINYNFYYWGPFLFKTKVLDEEIKKILFFCKKNKKLNCRHELAGHISDEYLLNNKDIFPLLLPYVETYLKTRYDKMGISFNGKIEMTGVWVNYMKQGEFNPPHTHIGDLSCVLYLQIPKDMDNNKKNHIARSEAPGSITFNYGENLKNNISVQNFFPKTGDFFIFPGWLQHYVFPFKSKGERISLSANFREIKEDSGLKNNSTT
jgi:uncharacterized protein (TIGR02466 family)